MASYLMPTKHTNLPAESVYSDSDYRDDPGVFQLNQEYSKRAAQLQQAYAGASAKADLDALGRGMTRSSYARDVQTRLTDSYLENRNELIGQRASELSEYLSDRAAQRAQQRQEAVKRNNDLLQSSWEADREYATLIAQQEKEAAEQSRKAQQQALDAWTKAQQSTAAVPRNTAPRTQQQPAVQHVAEQSSPMDVQEIYRTLKLIEGRDPATILRWRKMGWADDNLLQQAAALLKQDAYIQRYYQELYKQYS